MFVHITSHFQTCHVSAFRLVQSVGSVIVRFGVFTFIYIILYAQNIGKTSVTDMKFSGTSLLPSARVPISELSGKSAVIMTWMSMNATYTHL